MTPRQILFAPCLCGLALFVYLIDTSSSQEAPRADDASAAQQDPGRQTDQDDGAGRGRQGRRGGRGFRGSGRRGGGRGAEPDDTTGFVQIFDGQSLENWDGDPKFWRVEEGMIVGQSTPENRVQSNHIVAKGNTLLHFVNGRLLAGLIDENPSGGAYATEGILALQMHTGPPMKIEARNVWYKKL